MTQYDKLTETHSARLTKSGNVVLKTPTNKFTLKPEALRSFVQWLVNNCSEEMWLPEMLTIREREEDTNET